MAPTEQFEMRPSGAASGHRTGRGRRRIATVAALVVVASCGQQAERGADGGDANTTPAPVAASTDAVAASPVSGPDEVAVLRMGDGNEVRLPTGRPAILYFMSTLGCVECEPGAIALQDVAASIDVVALEVIPDAPPEWLDGYRLALGLDYTVAQDPDGVVANHYGVTDLSVAIAVDAEGNAVTDTFDPADLDQLTAALDRFDITIDVELPNDVDTTIARLP